MVEGARLERGPAERLELELEEQQQEGPERRQVQLEWRELLAAHQTSSVA
jgi:hypothetical protein